MKKFQKDIQSHVTGSESSNADEISDLDDAETNALLESLMQKLMDAQFFEEELISLAEKPITMLLPQGDRKRFYLFCPTLNMYRDVVAPVEAVVIDKTGEDETLCIINNVTYVVPNKYLTEVGYN